MNKCDDKITSFSVQGTSIKEFKDFPLKKNLLIGILDKGWKNPSPIQEASIKLGLSGKSTSLFSEPHSGITGAYLITVLQLVDPYEDHTQAIIISPSHGAMKNTLKLGRSLGKFTNVKIFAAINNTIWHNKRHIVIGMPKNLCELMDANGGIFDQCKILIFDKSENLSSSNVENLDNFLFRIPVGQQILYYPDKMSQLVNQFMQKYMKNQAEIILKLDEGLQKTAHYYACTLECEKINTLHTRILTKMGIKQSIILCKTHDLAKVVSNALNNLGHSCSYLHIEMTKSQKKHILHEFENKRIKNIACSNASKSNAGFFQSSVDTIIHFNSPTSSDKYIHGIGSCGKFNNNGLVINLITVNDRFNLQMIEEDINIDIQPLSNFVKRLAKEKNSDNDHQGIMKFA